MFMFQLRSLGDSLEWTFQNHIGDVDIRPDLGIHSKSRLEAGATKSRAEVEEEAHVAEFGVALLD